MNLLPSQWCMIEGRMSRCLARCLAARMSRCLARCLAARMSRCLARCLAARMSRCLARCLARHLAGRMWGKNDRCSAWSREEWGAQYTGQSHLYIVLLILPSIMQGEASHGRAGGAQYTLAQMMHEGKNILASHSSHWSSSSMHQWCIMYFIEGRIVHWGKSGFGSNDAWREIWEARMLFLPFLPCLTFFPQYILTTILHWEKNVRHCNTLQHTATHCNTLQHTATHCNTLKKGHILPSMKNDDQWKECEARMFFLPFLFPMLRVRPNDHTM